MNLKGKADLVVEGENLLEFINNVKKTCVIYSLKHESSKKIFLTIDFENLGNLFAKNSNKWYNIKVIKTYGLLPAVKSLKKRVVFLVGFLMLCAAFITFSCFLWQVEVSAKNEGDVAAVENCIQKLNLVSMPKSRYHKTEIEKYIYLNVDNVTYVNCFVEGVRLKVEVAFAIENGQAAANTDTIVATKSGTVSRILVYSGTAVVKIGDNVNVGDPLIVGEIQGQKVPCRGEVYVKNIFEEKTEILKEKTEYFLSGNFIDKKILNMLSFESSIEGNEIPYEKYKTEQFWYYPFANNLLPIKIVVTRYYELVPKVISSDFEANKNLYLAKAKHDMFLQFAGDYSILKELVEIEQTPHSDVINLFYEIEQKAV